MCLCQLLLIIITSHAPWIEMEGVRVGARRKWEVGWTRDSEEVRGFCLILSLSFSSGAEKC